MGRGRGVIFSGLLPSKTYHVLPNGTTPYPVIMVPPNPVVDSNIYPYILSPDYSLPSKFFPAALIPVSTSEVGVPDFLL